ncbi:MAG TPA: NAD-dependent DNA ligase LigA [Bacteriovoracaceae bacterium]|nr:NAD-dependent DNA ligase LigA [Bacteriovoracaceae bacterium]
MSTSRIKELEKLLLYHKELYYKGRPVISDEAYDKLEMELKELDPVNPILEVVGSFFDSVSDKVPHQRKMLSLDKTYEQDSLLKWKGAETVISVFKIDGSSCSLIYQNGKLELAKTRGDGSYGENVTSKVMYIKDVPLHTGTGDFEVRGEIYCSESGFAHIAEEMKKLGLEIPTSQRNIVAGLLGRKENIHLAKHLSFKAFDYISNEKFEFEHQKLDHLKKLDFDIPEYQIHKNKKSIEEAIAEAEEFMGKGDYLIDGLVFVYDRLAMHDRLGETSHHPRYKIAYKFAGETKNTTIQSIEWGVSRNGRLTPVAHVEPVELSGAMISRVTLHNYGMVKNFDLKPGDVIEIIRSGEVIPKFLSVITRNVGHYSAPAHCPSCESVLVIDDIWLNCINKNCPSKNKEEILNYIHKAGIDDLSGKRLDEMINKGLVARIPDLYKLEIDDLYKLDKVKEKLAQKIYGNIQKTKELKLSTFISAIGVEGVSIAKCEKIINAGYSTLEKIQNITLDQMMNIEGFAEKSSNFIIASLNEKKELIEDLLRLGVKVQSEDIVIGEGVLGGKKFCITGELSISRNDMAQKIKSNGGLVVSSVSKNTDFLLTNETDSTSSKFVKAKALGIKIITEDEFNQMI